MAAKDRADGRDQAKSRSARAKHRDASHPSRAVCSRALGEKLRLLSCLQTSGPNPPHSGSQRRDDPSLAWHRRAQGGTLRMPGLAPNSSPVRTKLKRPVQQRAREEPGKAGEKRAKPAGVGVGKLISFLIISQHGVPSLLVLNRKVGPGSPLSLTAVCSVVKGRGPGQPW